MNKFVFGLLVSSVFFGEISSAMAARTMNAENGPRKISIKKATVVEQDKVNKPAPHRDEQRTTKKISKDFEKLVQYAEEELKALKVENKENKPSGIKKYKISQKGVFLMDVNGNFLPCKGSSNKHLHTFSVKAIPGISVIVATPVMQAQVIQHLTRSTAQQLR